MKKILVIEDEPVQQLLYKEEIADWGYQVEVAGDEGEARRKMASFEPDLLVMDIRLPGKNGLELIRDFLKENPRLKVVIHSAYSHYKEDFLSWAAEEYIVKSSDLSELKEAIHRVLSRPKKK
ncbi:MAG: response regulator [Calditrichia bacterium]